MDVLYNRFWATEIATQIDHTSTSSVLVSEAEIESIRDKLVRAADTEHSD